MDSKRQGTICLTIGLVALCGFLLLDHTSWNQPTRTQATVSTAAAASPPPAVIDSRLQQFEGQWRSETIHGAIEWKWTVDTYSLPRGADGLRPVLVHSVRKPISGWSWPQKAPSDRRVCLVLWRDEQGHVVDAMIPDRLDLALLPVHLLACRLPELVDVGLSSDNTTLAAKGTSSDAIGVTPPADGNDPNEFSWQGPEPDPVVLSMGLKDESESVSMGGMDDEQRKLTAALRWKLGGRTDRPVLTVADTNVRMRIDGILRQTDVHFSQATGTPVGLMVWARHRNAKQEERKTGLLAVQNTRLLDQDEVNALAADLASWQDCTARLRGVLGAASDPRTEKATVGTQQQSLQLTGTSKAVAAAQHPVSQLGMRQALITQGIDLPRCRNALAVLHRFESGKPIEWSVPPETGSTASITGGGSVAETGLSSDHLRGHVTALAFVCLGAPETGSAMQAIDRLHDEYADRGLKVVAFSTDYHDEDRLRMAASVEGKFPVLRGIQAANDLNAYTAGMPLILLVDGGGSVRFLHAWQAQSDSRLLASQVGSLLETQPSAQHAEHAPRAPSRIAVVQ